MEPQAIRYHCQRCGNCCRWPGEVVISDAEISAIALHLGLPEQGFIATYTALRKSRMGLTLKQKADGACILLEADACSVHAVKPAQCRAFPNNWRFPGWRQICEATPELDPTQPPSQR